MGKRSTNTTNRVKYVNPADHARKQARKKELKKNKKQRQMVRTAVLKGKDPNQIIKDLESIDEMEYNVYTPPPLSEKVLREKRKKLKETWERVLMLYKNENVERYYELKMLEREYESLRAARVKYYESVRSTQQVQPDEIPLPNIPNEPLVSIDQIPMPNEPPVPLAEPEFSNLKKSVVSHPLDQSAKLKPPGLPPGPPPDLSSDEDENADTGGSKGIKIKSRTVRFADRTVTDSGEDDDVNKSEGERQTCYEEQERSAIKRRKLFRTIQGDEKGGHDQAVKSFADAMNIPVHAVPLPAGPPLGLLQCPPPVSVPPTFRPPQLRPGLPLPPRSVTPGIPPPPPSPRVPLLAGALPIRLPPGPPPGVPPVHLIGPPVGPPSTFTVLPPRLSVVTTSSGATESSVPATAGLAVLSAPPQTTEEVSCPAIIEAKPQVTSLSAEVKKFIPTSLRIKRAGKYKKSSSQGGSALKESKDVCYPGNPVSNPSVTVPTKDDAYLQFLKEMQEFL